MADIRPFRAYRYDSHRVALQDVLTQPYDKITPAMQDRYYAASPYNLIPVEKGRALPDDSPEENVYTRAARKIDEWIAEKIIVQDAAPNIYVYSQEFCVPGTKSRRTRIGFIALARLENYEAHVVFRHEHTLSGPRADRIELLRHTRAQTGQLFLLYDDPSKQIDTWLDQVAHTSPDVELHDEFGVTHRMWPVPNPAFAERIENAMAGKSIVIADGHHRYETALSYRDECRLRAGKADPQAAYEFAMATFINTHSKGLTILPTHRLVRNLPGFDFDHFRAVLTPYFDWYAYPFVSADDRAGVYAEFRKDLERPNHGRRAIGAYPRAAQSGVDAFYLFVLRRGVDLESLLPDLSEGQRGLDVVLLHRLILNKGLGITAEAVTAEKNLTYEREMEAAIASVDRGDAQLALLLNPVRVDQVMKIALAGDVLPQKSTDFYPKMLSGIAVYRIEGRVGE
ncbi:MAG TPA: DUF1015 domain-containing protein [Verrucomicrobiae bacterium]|nr:DUF1015 domain-containing protein [Verrucomicrobiae bacterium]